MITAEYLEAEIATMRKIMENPNHQDDFTEDLEILNLALGALRVLEKTDPEKMQKSWPEYRIYQDIRAIITGGKP